MKLPGFDDLFDFFGNYGFAFLGVLILGLGCFCCLLYTFAVLCDKNAQLARQLCIVLWGISFLQNLLMFNHYPWYFCVAGLMQECIVLLLVNQIPSINLQSKVFYCFFATTLMLQGCLLYVFFTYQYRLYELLIILVTLYTTPILALTSIQVSGERVLGTGAQSLLI